MCSKYRRNMREYLEKDDTILDSLLLSNVMMFSKLSGSLVVA